MTQDEYDQIKMWEKIIYTHRHLDFEMMMMIK